MRCYDGNIKGTIVTIVYSYPILEGFIEPFTLEHSDKIYRKMIAVYFIYSYNENTNETYIQKITVKA